MGYSTDFSGCFTVNDKPLSKEHVEYLAKFADTRRMKRNAALTEKRDDPIRKAAGLPVGPDGGYFVAEDGVAGQGAGFGTQVSDVVDHNVPPTGQPGLWCQWVPNADGTAIEWDGGEKFYDYVEWLEYIIVNFLKPWGYTISGEVEWQGEDRGDMGKIIVKKNKVTVKHGKIVY
jgi:hypothetical protein